jgi:hypothetical protein
MVGFSVDPTLAIFCAKRTSTADCSGVSRTDFSGSLRDEDFQECRARASQRLSLAILSSAETPT